uniref:Uncharacterized protein n=1 Tax=Utricularia reniformis TaxID=192314 RepID=A0A1Y0B3G2_9LAMI|nr:hypothetical protein AEK19_MT1747 [Utricularia reniformis]ART31924.1 hypothetical protein AEK19_MT1747 [Utricularia reniformis]
MKQMIVRINGYLSGCRPCLRNCQSQKTSFITISDREGLQTSY